MTTTKKTPQKTVTKPKVVTAKKTAAPTVTNLPSNPFAFGVLDLFCVDQRLVHVEDESICALFGRWEERRFRLSCHLLH